MSDPVQDAPELYARFDVVVRLDGRDSIEVWQGLEEVLCPRHPHPDGDDDGCSIEAGFCMIGTLVELKAANGRRTATAWTPVPKG